MIDVLAGIGVGLLAISVAGIVHYGVEMKAQHPILGFGLGLVAYGCGASACVAIGLGLLAWGIASCANL